MIITEVNRYFDFDGNPNGYRATVDGEIIFVPLDEANLHYKEIQIWSEEEGNVINDDDIPTP